MTAGQPKVALFGCGAWGMNHVRVWDKLGALAVVCDPDVERLGALQERFPDVRTTTDPSEVFESNDIRAAIVASPATTHGELALGALKAGLDVLVEKPMATSVAEAAALVEAAHESGSILMVGHVLEYHPAFKALLAAVLEGDIGQLRYVYSNRLNFGRLRTEENALWSFAPHDTALILRILNKMPSDVSCHGGSYLSSDVADVTLVNMTFADGVRSHIFVSWLHPFKEHRFVVVGDRQMVVFDDSAAWDRKLTFYPHTVSWKLGTIPIATQAEGVQVPVEEGEPLEIECRHFLDCIESRKTPLTDGESGLRVLRVLESAQRSLNEGGTVTRMTDPSHARSFVHPTAVVDDGADVGADTTIWHFSHVMEGAAIGTKSNLGQNVFVGRGVRIGNGVKIQNNVSVYSGVELEDDVFCGPSVVFTNVRNPRSEVDRKSEFLPTLVKRGATLGANSTIVCGVVVGSYAFVAAGATVTKDVPDHGLVMGSPATLAGWMCRCGTRLPSGQQTVTCTACGRSYQVEAEEIRLVSE